MRLLYCYVACAVASLLFVQAGSTASPAERTTARRPIVIGLHAPFTGAVPLPSRSLQAGSDIYWKWLRHQGRTIGGRDVRVILKNDNTNPSQAAKVCRRLIRDDGADILAGVLQGGFGSVQSQVCARVAASLGVPYVSLGGTTQHVKNLKGYFAISMTFRAQGRSLADYFIQRMNARSRKNGLVSYNTPHEMEAVNAFSDQLEDRKADLDLTRLLSRNAGASEAQAVAAELQTTGVENVFAFTTPTFFIQLLQAADSLNYNPVWSGPGITVTNSDSVVALSCGGGAPFRGRFFSPLPAFQDRDDYDKTFDRAMAEIYPNGPKDTVVWQGWSTAKQLAEMLRTVDGKLTTGNFIAGVEDAHDLRTGILPAVNFSRKDHFGASRTYVLSPRCSDERWHTRAKKYH